jgi:hypothetical protein
MVFNKTLQVVALIITLKTERLCASNYSDRLLVSSQRATDAPTQDIVLQHGVPFSVASDDSTLIPKAMLISYLMALPALRPPFPTSVALPLEK